ncbi:unnamed protein product [Caenorhabditis brenneri]
MSFKPTAMFFVNCTQSREVSSFIHNLWSIPSKMYLPERGREREHQLYEQHILGKTIKRIKGDMLTQLLEKGRFTDDIKRWVTGSSDITENSEILPFLNVSLSIQNAVVTKEIKEGSFNFTTENGRSTKSVALQTKGTGESNIENSTTISEGSDSPAAQPIHTSTSETYYNSSSTPETSELSQENVYPSSQDNQPNEILEEMREEMVNSTLEHIALTTSVPVQTIKSEASTTSIINTEQSIKTTATDLILATELPEEIHSSGQVTQNSLLIGNNTEPTSTLKSETYHSSTIESPKLSQEDGIVSHVSYSNQTDDDISTLIKNSSDISDVHNSSSDLPDALHTTSKPLFNLESSNRETGITNLYTMTSATETYISSTPITSQSLQEDGIGPGLDYSKQTDDFASTLIKNSSDIFDVHNSSSGLPDALNATSKPSFSLKNFDTEMEVQNSNNMTSTSKTYNISTPITSQSSQEDGIGPSLDYSNQTDDYASTLIKNSSDIFDVFNSSSKLPEASHTTSKPSFSLKSSNTETEITNLYTMTRTSETYNISTPITSQSLQEDGLISSDEYGNQTDDFASTLIKNSSDIFDVHNSSSELPDALNTTSKPLLNLKNSNTEPKVQNSNTVGNESHLPDDPDNATRTLAMDNYLNLRPPSSIKASNGTTLAGHSVTTPAPTTVRQSLLSRLAPSTLHARDRMLTSTELPKTTTRYLSKCAKDRLRNNKSVREI